MSGSWSFDALGINVWCAAGKGTFGTEEFLLRIAAGGLKNVVKHRDLILPQLGAHGVSAHLVRKQSGFRVHYGPVLALDVLSYIDAGLRATAEMRRKAFPLRERAVLIPMELVAALKPAMVILPILFLVSGFGGEKGFVHHMTHDGVFSMIAFLCAVFSGAVLTPLFLPCLPGCAFTMKGLAVGLPAAIALLCAWGGDLRSWRDILLGGAWLPMIPALSAYPAMNFTGCAVLLLFGFL